MKYHLSLIFFLSLSLISFAQDSRIIGSVKDAETLQPIAQVNIYLEGSPFKAQTNHLGEFVLEGVLPLGEQILVISKSGYTPKRYPIILNEEELLTINDMVLSQNYNPSNDLFTITLSEEELHDDTIASDNVSGLLAASMDVFQRTAAFEFSPSFFRPRGLDSNHSTVLINGVEMNKSFNGRPQWSNWGGLNDVLRNQELVFGLAPSSSSFGGALGSTNINVRASEARAGGRLTYSSSNRSYAHRIMAKYASGLVKNDWAYTISIGRRWGAEGYQEATMYSANSFFTAVEKKISEKHRLNLTAIYTPNSRGKSSPNTQEVYDLKDTKYNEYWGRQDGEKRNSRIKEVNEPIFMLNHYWNLNAKTTLNTNLAYQFGRIGNSRLDYNGTDLIDGMPQGGGANPSPTYYQKLPSYFERNDPDDLDAAYQALKAFQNDGQLHWNAIYQANIAHAEQGGNAIYALYEDRVDDTQFTVNSILNSAINQNVFINAALNYKALNSENFAQVIDLLGASQYLDVDAFASNSHDAQNDLQHPNRLVSEGEKFKYHYHIYSKTLGAFAQAQFRYSKMDCYVSGQFSQTQYQREGLYQNGGFPDNSFGKGEKLNFSSFGLKAGLTYKLSGKHLFDGNIGLLSRAPSIQNTFSNSRENHNTVPDISTEKIRAFDASYTFRSAFVKAKITGYFIEINDANDIAFYFADGVGGDHAVFVQEILQDIKKRHLGTEMGVEAQVTSTLKLKAVASIGQFTYANNPKLLLTTEPDAEAIAAGFVNGAKDFGATSLKNYRLASGPQQAYSIGFEYRDPDYWWFGATANFLSDTFLDVSPLTRSSNFSTDYDGQVFNDYDPDIAMELLKQEQFDAYMLVNLIGGKSWKLGKHYVGLFASVNNLLNTTYKTGGFEQGRNANYRELRDDKALETPVFGPKYWYGRGTTYFLNLNVSF